MDGLLAKMFKILDRTINRWFGDPWVSQLGSLTEFSLKDKVRGFNITFRMPPN